MATTCLQLLQLNSFQHIRLVAGESGLYRKLSWPHIYVTPPLCQWLHGGELLFVTGTSLEMDEDALMTLLRESILEKLSGIVLLVGGESKLVTTETLRKYADEHEFPLFEMPWELKLVDVIQEISEMIISQNGMEDTRQRFFFEMLFSPDRPRKFENLSSLYGIASYTHLAVAILHPCAAAEPDLGDLIHKLAYHQALHQSAPDTSMIPAKHIGNVVCLLMANSEKALRSVFSSLEYFIDSFAPKYYPKDSLKLSFSHIASAHTSIQHLYNEADMTLRILNRNSAHGNHLHYENLGIYKLFFEIPEESRKTYWQECLGALIQEDHNSNSNLLETLRAYLASGCSAIAASQQLFIHKNTLLYRLNRIKAILNADLNDPFIRNSLFTALLLYDAFNSDL